MTIKLKAISLLQPWATLVAMGVKTIETRSWSTKYRGPLVICSSAAIPARVKKQLNDHTDPLSRTIFDYTGQFAIQLPMPLGQALCVVDLVDCIPGVNFRRTKTQGWERDSVYSPEVFAYDREFIMGDLESSPKRFGWLLTRVRRLPLPYHVKGTLGLWDIELPEEALR